MEVDLCKLVTDCATTSAAVAAVRTYLSTQPFRTALAPCVLALLAHHEGWERKSAGGVLHAQKVRAGESFGLELVKRGSVIEPIRWAFAVESLMRKAHGRQRLDPKRRFRTFISRVARYAVRGQTDAARIALGGRKGDGRDVDHTNEGGFAAILDLFLASDSFIPTHKDGEHFFFSNAEQLKRWQNLHQKHATFQLLSKAQHVALTRSRKTKPVEKQELENVG
jgi:hypothetical protein